MTEKDLLEKLINDLTDFNVDHLAMLTELDLSGNDIDRWKQNRDKLRKVEDDFNNFLLVRSGRTPIF